MANWNLDDSTLEAYIKGFYGHGKYEARYWFIGMEFGGGGSEAEVVSRIQGWHDRGGRELEDLGGTSKWFREPVPLQPTWAKLMRIILQAEGMVPTNEQLKAYQKERLGRQNGLDCILELLPLPSPGLNRWLFYAENSKLPYLKDRATYTSHVAPMRVEHLRKRIAEHRPGAVVFYGRGYEHWWSAVAGAQFKASHIEKMLTVRNEHTLFVVMRHPTAFGHTNAYFDGIGRFIADELQR